MSDLTPDEIRRVVAHVTKARPGWGGVVEMLSALADDLEAERQKSQRDEGLAQIAHEALDTAGWKVVDPGAGCWRCSDYWRTSDR